MTTNETDRTDDRGPASEVYAPDEAREELEVDEIEEAGESGPAADPAPSALEEPEPAVSSVDGPLLADTTGYQDRWYEIQTGFVDEPRNAVQSAGELLTEMMDDLTSRLTSELGAFDAPQGADSDVSTEDLRVAFQRYRAFFDRLLAA